MRDPQTGLSFWFSEATQQTPQMVAASSGVLRLFFTASPLLVQVFAFPRVAFVSGSVFAFVFVLLLNWKGIPSNETRRAWFIGSASSIKQPCRGWMDGSSGVIPIFIS